MIETIKEQFLAHWSAYVPGVSLPVIFYYSDNPTDAERVMPAEEWRCVIADLARVRRGKSLAFDVAALGCGGAKRFFGMSHELSPDFEYFLSCGIPGKREGIRYKKTPELVAISMAHQKLFDAPGKYIVFKRWDNMSEADHPAAVIFFDSGDVLAALFSLANFDRSDPFGVISPSCSGCSAIVYYALKEAAEENPRAIFGMFDLSARPFVAPDIFTISIPWGRFGRMVENMPESFLITETWEKLKKRLPDNKSGSL